MMQPNWALNLITEPAIEPISVEEAKLQARIENAEDDYSVMRTIKAVRSHVEETTGRALITQTREFIMDDWPVESVFNIPRPPLQSITSIKYKDVNGAEATWASSNYIVDVDSEPGRVGLIYGGVYPSTTLQPIAGIRVRFVAGYGATAESVPGDIKQAMLLMISHFYEHREEVLVGQVQTMAVKIPLGAARLLAPWTRRFMPVCLPV